MAASFPAVNAESALQSSVELRANGEISRMRSHKGNMPSLPQNKFCSLCPAKFTRTTHLNRHLRSHTNERSHRCEVCHAEFTRSDLLTRHKRTCGDSNSQRSRRKSCQSCADSKVKCNLQYPCSKCLARGRECVFINDPEASRTRKAAKRPTPPRPGITVDSDLSFSRGSTSPLYSQQSSVPSPQSPYYSMVYPSPISTVASPIDAIHPSPDSTNHLENVIPFGLPNLCYSSSSSASSSRSSSRLEPFDLIPNLGNLNFDGLETNSQLDDFFPIPNQQHERSFLDSFVNSCGPEESARLVSEANTGELCSGIGNDESFSYQQPVDSTLPSDIPGTTSLDSPSFPVSLSHVHHIATASGTNHSNGPLFDSSECLPVSESESEDLEHYLSMFSAAFCVQLPLVHHPTWTMAGKHPMLVSAMHACGAIFVRSDTALSFVRRTLVFLRDNLIAEFSKPECSLKDRFSLVVAVVLLQSLGLLWRQPDQSSTTKVFHGLLITMIRKLGLIKILSAWTPPDLTNSYALDTAWREWARYETLKRVVFLAYVQDCSDTVFFSASPLLHPGEMEIKLPCDEGLWGAETAKEWYQELHTPSPYGAGPRRLASVSMQQALASLDVSVPPEVQAQLNPFSHFIVIHTILRNIFTNANASLGSSSFNFEDHGHDRSQIRRHGHSGHSSSYSSGSSSTNSPELPSGSSYTHSNSRGISNEYTLHNWLQMWTHNPEGFDHHRHAHAHHHHHETSTTSTPFICSSLPFYWLAHYSNTAIQEGYLDLRRHHAHTSLGASNEDMEAQERCRLITAWLNQINAYLSKGYRLPERVQDFGLGESPRGFEQPFGGEKYFGGVQGSPVGYR